MRNGCIANTKLEIKRGFIDGAQSPLAREIVKAVKDSKKKVQVSIQGDVVRVSGRDRDSLQEIITLLRGQDFGIDMQFTNYRSN